MFFDFETVNDLMGWIKREKYTIFVGMTVENGKNHNHIHHYCLIVFHLFVIHQTIKSTAYTLQQLQNDLLYFQLSWFGAVCHGYEFFGSG